MLNEIKLSQSFTNLPGLRLARVCITFIAIYMDHTACVLYEGFLLNNNKEKADTVVAHHLYSIATTTI